jgi:AcrR family transcriptional regulator
MPGRKPARSYHDGDLRAALKRAALKLVRQKGPRGFSLNEASRLAGVTVAAPYRHFKDKDALLAELICDGNAILETQVRAAASTATDIREQMLEAGMAYLRFASIHSDYFSVIFNSGIDKSKYPNVQRSARDAFGVILSLAQKFERTPKLAQERAISAWAFVHGLATLGVDEALFVAAEQEHNWEYFRPILRRFLDQRYA